MVRILVVDDDPEVLRSFRRYLELAGCAVETAAHVRGALLHLRQAAFDVVITDLIMEDQDGLSLLKSVRRDHPGTRVIAISGGGISAPDSYLSSALRLGADAAFRKPVPMDQLLAEIRAMTSSTP